MSGCMSHGEVIIASLLFFRISNYIEAGLWCLIGLGLGTGVIRGATLVGWRRTAAAAVFVLFGISDLIEARTGAWYRPLGLLLLKAACLAVILWLLGAELRHRHKSR